MRIMVIVALSDVSDRAEGRLSGYSQNLEGAPSIESFRMPAL